MYALPTDAYFTSTDVYQNFLTDTVVHGVRADFGINYVVLNIANFELAIGPVVSFSYSTYEPIWSPHPERERSTSRTNLSAGATLSNKFYFSENIYVSFTFHLMSSVYTKFSVTDYMIAYIDENRDGNFDAEDTIINHYDLVAEPKGFVVQPKFSVGFRL